MLTTSRIPKEELEKIKHKGIAETPDLIDIGIHHNAFKRQEVLCIDKTWSRIERPKVNDATVHSVLIWERKTPEDTEPCMEKVVSAFYRFSR